MAKTLQIWTGHIAPFGNSSLDLGRTAVQFKDLWLDGKAYIDGLGESVLVDSLAQIQFRDTSTYIYSSLAGHISLTATISIDILGHLDLSAKNFITDTVTGTRVGTTTNTKLGFFNAAPVVQQGTCTTLWQVRNALSTLGFISGVGTFRDVSFATTSATYTLTTADDLLICNSGTAFTVNLPVAVGSGKIYQVKNIGTGLVTLDGNGSETIDGATTQPINQWENIVVVDFSSTVDPVYGADVLTGGTAWANETTWGAANLTVDNNTGTYWAIGAAATGLWAYNLGAGVTKVVQKFSNYPYANPSNFIKNFSIGGSTAAAPTITDDTAWTTIYTAVDPSTLAVWHDHTFSNTTAYRCYRVKIVDGWAAGKGASREFEMKEMTSDTVPGRWLIL